jgi:hypothetical protein
MKPTTNVCFLWEDFLIQNKERLSEEELRCVELGKIFTEFNTAKEYFKQNIYSLISLSDTQEVWPEVLNALERAYIKNCMYRVWSNKKILGFSFYPKI